MWTSDNSINRLWMHLFVRLKLITIILLTFYTEAESANIEMIKNKNNNIIFVSGTIYAGDPSRFLEVSKGVKKSYVIMAGGGGEYLQALLLGNEIHKRGYATVVLDHEVCAAACALVWLSGRERYAGRKALIGLNWIYSLEPYPENLASMSATLGAYLSNIGFDTQLIERMVEIQPHKSNWSVVEMLRKNDYRVGLPPEWIRAARVKSGQKNALRFQEIEAIYKQIEIYSYLSMRFKREFAKFVSGVFDYQFIFRNETLGAMFDLYNVSLATISKYSSDEEIYNIALAQYEDLQLLQKLDPRLCAEIYYPYRDRRFRGRNLIEGATDKYKDKISAMILSALRSSEYVSEIIEPALSRDEVRAQWTKTISVVQSGFSGRDLRLFNHAVTYPGQWDAAPVVEPMWKTVDDWNTACEITKRYWQTFIESRSITISFARNGLI